MTRTTAFASLFALGLTACGGGVPIEIRIDEFRQELNLNDAVAELEQELFSSGLLPLGAQGLPELWPDSLPPIQTSMPLATPPAAIDLTPPEDSENYDKYKDINKAKAAIRRIEINRLVLRVEQTTLTMDLPELALQVADEPTADPDDRRAWFTVGRLPAVPAGTVGDSEFEWVTGGESFLNSQLGDEVKEFALRTIGTIAIDTAANPALPRGMAALRVIVLATFFVDPEKAL